MDTLQDLCLVGLSHRSAPVAVRERYAVQPGDARECLEELCRDEAILEATLLSTCNRTEVLVLGKGVDAAAATIRRQLFRNLDEQHLYEHRGVHAVMHLFRVASGLDSLILGESEILAQVKRGLETARLAGTLGEHLQPMLTQALQVGKRMRNETEIGQGTLSVAKVAVDIAHRAFGKFGDKRGLIVGAGETGLLVARHLRDAGIGGLDFVNRTADRAENAAAEFGGTAFRLDELAAAVAGADLVVVCVDGGAGLVTPAHFAGRRNRDRPTLVVDLSVPRAVLEAVADLPNLLLYNLDDLEPVVERNRRARGEASVASSEILVAEVHKFLTLRTYAAFSPAIADLRQRYDEVREEIVDEICQEQASPRELQLAHELSKRLLDLSLEKMKEGARRARSEESLDREYQRYLQDL